MIFQAFQPGQIGISHDKDNRKQRRTPFFFNDGKPDRTEQRPTKTGDPPAAPHVVSRNLRNLPTRSQSPGIHDHKRGGEINFTTAKSQQSVSDKPTKRHSIPTVPSRDVIGENLRGAREPKCSPPGSCVSSKNKRRRQDMVPEREHAQNKRHNATPRTPQFEHLPPDRNILWLVSEERRAVSRAHARDGGVRQTYDQTTLSSKERDRDQNDQSGKKKKTQQASRMQDVRAVGAEKGEQTNTRRNNKEALQRTVCRLDAQRRSALYPLFAGDLRRI